MIEHRYTKKDLESISDQWAEELKIALNRIQNDWMEEAFIKMNGAKENNV